MRKGCCHVFVHIYPFILASIRKKERKIERRGRERERERVRRECRDEFYFTENRAHNTRSIWKYQKYHFYSKKYNR